MSAQRQVTTSSMSGLTAGYTISGLQTLIANMKTAMQTSKPILASDMQHFIPDIINPIHNHVHDASDMQGKDTFGNVTTYGVSGQVVLQTSGVAVPAWNAATNIPFTADNPITYGDVNYIRGFVNGMLSHTHAITDTKGATDVAVAYPGGILQSESGSGGSDADGYLYLVFQNDGNMVMHYTYNNVGTPYNGVTSRAPYAGAWINMNPVDAATAANYDLKISVTGNTGAPTTYPGSLTPDTWYNLGANRMYGISVAWPGDPYTYAFGYRTINVQIRDAATGTVLINKTNELRIDLYHYEQA